MPTEPDATDALVQTLGDSASDALLRWAESQARSVRLASPPWTAKGYTGALLVAINVSHSGGPDTKLIVKVCPPGPYARETAAHHRARAASSPDFFASHLVDQVFDAYPTPDGGFLMFQEIAGASLALRPLGEVPDDQFTQACETVVTSIITSWNPSLIRADAVSVGDFLRRELRSAWDTGGSVRALASHMRLLAADSSWLADDDLERLVPNPFLMITDMALGSDIRLDVVNGPMHGDLHLDNVLVPAEYGQLHLNDFRLVDLSTFEADAPITRDPVNLMLSVIAPAADELRQDEQEALLVFVLQPWVSSPPRVSALTASTLEAIYRAGNEAVKAMRLGDWRSQYLLSVQATALLFTSFESLGDRGRWWFLRLATRAAAEFLQLHHRFHPRSPVVLRRPVAWPVARPAQALPGSGIYRTARAEVRSRKEGLDPALLGELVALIGGVSPALLHAVYLNVIDSPNPHPQPNWGDANAVVRWLLIVDEEWAEPIPTALAYIDRLAHAVERLEEASERAAEFSLHQWLNRAAQRLDVSDEDLRHLCIESERQMGSYALPGLPVSHTTGRTESKSSRTTGAVVVPSEMSDKPGGAVSSPATSVRSGSQPPVLLPRRPIRSKLPAKNPDFTGREELLRTLASTLQAQHIASVVPQALHGLGGVGKTQLAIEYVYRHLEDYELIGWITAEDPFRTRADLVELAELLQVPPGQDMKQTISLVLDALSTSAHRWLLVYDNVGEPDDLAGLVPSAGGHVLITSRNNAAWSTTGNAIEVDVFQRHESVELLRRHSQSIGERDADLLAEKLGDLPLALEQAATWHTATGMPIAEYLELFDENVKELLSEGKPTDYPETIYAFLKVAVGRLREQMPAAAELLELFAYLGAEPISVSLLRRAHNANLSEHLARAIGRPIELNRAIREIRRYGLARVDLSGQRVQVHRLIQHVLHEELREQNLVQARINVQRLLASANPAYPDEPSNWPVHAEIGPHIRASELVHAQDEAARSVVLDQIRYLFKIGDYEGSRDLAETVHADWSRTDPASPGPDHELTLIAARHLANALRVLGQTERARILDMDTFQRLRDDPRFGEDHEHTLYTANSLGVDLRLKGDFRGALAVENDNVERHERVFGPGDEHTWLAQNNLAVSLRHLGDFRHAFDIDDSVVTQWREHVGTDDSRTLFAVANLARDLYGLGQYAKALETQRKALPRFREALGERHSDVLQATRTVSIALRKMGYYADARDSARDSYHDHHARFGGEHEHALAATLSYANALRCCGDVAQARSLLYEAADRYRDLFGPSHPLTLAAQVDLAIALRGVQDRGEARALGSEALSALERVLGLEHPYSLCAATGLANDLALAGERDEALALSQRTLQLSRQTRGDSHPDTLSCEINAALDLLAVGRDQESLQLREHALGQMRDLLGVEHPQRADAMRGQRAECDIEPPPT